MSHVDSNEFYVRLHVDDLTNAVKLTDNPTATVQTFVGTIYQFQEFDAELVVWLSADYVIQEDMAPSTLGALAIDGDLDVEILPPP